MGSPGCPGKIHTVATLYLVANNRAIFLVTHAHRPSAMMHCAEVKPGPDTRLPPKHLARSGVWAWGFTSS